VGRPFLFGHGSADLRAERVHGVSGNRGPPDLRTSGGASGGEFGTVRAEGDCSWSIDGGPDRGNELSLAGPNRAVPSSLAVTMTPPRGLNSPVTSLSVCPARVVMGSPVGRVPEPGGAVRARGGDHGSIRAEGDSGDGPGVPGERCHGLASACVPEPSGVEGAAGRGDGAAVGAELHRCHVSAVRGEDRDELAGAGVPEAAGAVLAGCGKCGAVGAEGEAQYGRVWPVSATRIALVATSQSRAV
jgi:hypothetical protein